MANKTHPLVQGLFSFDGRMRRSEYWLTSLGLGIFKAILTFMLAAFTGELGRTDGGWASIVIELLFLWPTLAILVKRGHDRNRPALFSIGLMVVLLVVAMVMGALQVAGGSMLMFACLIVIVGAAGFMLIDYGFIDGTQGPNRYGPSPKGIGPQHAQQDLAQVFD